MSSVSRRSFLRGTALLSGAAAVSAVAPPPAQAGAKPCGSLPKPIAALKPLQGEARPITHGEREARLDQARSLMTANKLDAIMLMEGTSLQYYTGIRWWGGERLFACLLPAKGEAIFVCPAFEQGRAHEQIARSPLAHAEIRLWQENEDPYQRVAQALSDRGVSAGTLGIEETVRYVFSSGVAQAAPGLRLASATPVTAGCRMVKSGHELELMRLAAKATLLAYQAAYHSLDEGMTNQDAGRLVTQAHTQLGFECEADVQVGEYSANPHGSIAPQVIREGTIVMIDGGCRVEGYVSDITRTFVLGKASDKMRRIFDIVHQAQSTALKTAAPGVPAESVDAAARKVITDAGYGPGYKYFTHRVGHGMGMDGHEWPYLVGGDTLPLAAHMMFSDEPGVYLPGEFGIRLEDDMHITEKGAELFTPQSPSLEQPFEKT
jgi:Xaa-Pro dipeptidase